MNSLLTNTCGHDNTATGLQAMLNNTSGFDNTATGVNSLQSRRLSKQSYELRVALEQITRERLERTLDQIQIGSEEAQG